MTKITSYKYDGSKEESELRKLGEQYSEFEQTDYCKENKIYPNLQWLSSLEDKIKSAEEAKKHLAEFKRIADSQESLYEVWYYFKPDMYNNGGTRTNLTKEQLDHLIKRGNELTEIFFVTIYDINESFKQGKKIIPNFLSDEIKQQLNNKDFNSWHNSLLGN